MMDKQYKQRLVGAGILVGFLVMLFLTIFKNHRAMESSAISTDSSSTQRSIASTADVKTITIDQQSLLERQQSQQVVWGIQLASFQDQAHAQQLKQTLQQHNYHAIVQPSSNHKGQFYRVMVGPISTHKRAKSLQSSLQGMLNLHGLVMKTRAFG